MGGGGAQIGGGGVGEGAGGRAAVLQMGGRVGRSWSVLEGAEACWSG